MNATKATGFYEIQDAVAFNTPIDETHEFYTDFSAFRNDFKEKKFYKILNINPNTKNCNPLKTHKKIFLSGYKGTGKTSELLKLTNAINATQCYFTVFVDIADEELDTNNIETVDVLILMLEKLVNTLNQNNIEVGNEVLKSFYKWYETRITEVNEYVKATGTIEVETKAKIPLLPLFLTLIAKTKAQLQTSTDTKEKIRQVFNNKFSDFSIKFNEFILSLKEQFHKEEKYKDILFILDGFEKIGSYESQKKILLDDANKFVIIQSHIIITLPIELFCEKGRLNNFSTTLHFPLIDLKKKEAKNALKEFIYKRVDASLFKTLPTVNKIIKYGAGHPRQTLQIINRAYIEAENDIIDMQSVNSALDILSNEMSELNEEEIRVLKKLKKNKTVASSDEYVGLKAKNIIFDYGINKEEEKINPIVLLNKKLMKQIEALDD